MYASVYRLRRKGVKLPRAQQGVDGYLVLQVSPIAISVPNALRASLLLAGNTTAMALPELDRALVTRITRNGIVIHGFEIIPRRDNNKSAIDQFRQTWWCLIHTAQNEQDIIEGEIRSP